jgi:exosome complex RNA-binding protein Rrp42 (RNase PH superfamily)
LEEEFAQTGRAVFVLNSHRELCAISYTGLVALTPEKILLCSAIAGSKVAEITRIIREAVSGTKSL